MKLNSVTQGDCLEVMKLIPDGSVDMILCDLPYGTTKNKWDSIISLPDLWVEYERIIKLNGAIVLTAQTPFDKVLGASNLRMLKYEWIWKKPRASGHLNSKFSPLKNHENILVFSEASAAFVKDKSKAMIYNPQFTKGKPYTIKSGRASSNYDLGNQQQVITENKGDYYPTSVLEYASETGLHPTQKPVALFEYLIKTYTNEGQTVLDNCAGSGTTAISAINTKRKYILIEQEEKYIDIINERIKDHTKQINLF